MTERDNPIGEDDLHAYVDRRLQPERVEAVEAYLNANTEVASRVSAWRAQRETLRDQLAAKAAEPIPARLRISNIRAARRQSRLRQFRMVAASVAWLFAGGAAGWIAAKTDWSVSRPVPAVMVSDAISAYRTFVVDVSHPVEVKATEGDHLVEWLSKRLGQRRPRHPIDALFTQRREGRDRLSLCAGGKCLRVLLDRPGPGLCALRGGQPGAPAADRRGGLSASRGTGARHPLSHWRRSF